MKPILDILNKKVFKEIVLFELILFSFTFIVGTLLFIWQIIGSDISTNIMISYTLTLIDIPLGIIAAMALSRKWKYAPLLLAFDAILYGTSNFLSANVFLGIVNAILTPFLWFLAFFYLWNSKINKNIVETRKLNLKNGITLVISILAVSTFIGWLGMIFQENNYTFEIWFDSFAGSLMLFAVVLSILRFRETWFLFFVANWIKILLFSITVSQGNFEDLMLLVIASAYFINSIYGMTIWNNSEVYKFPNIIKK